MSLQIEISQLKKLKKSINDSFGYCLKNDLGFSHALYELSEKIENRIEHLESEYEEEIAQ